MIIAIVLIVIVVVGFLLFAFRPRYATAPPLALAPDDPLLVESVAKARAAIPKLRELFAQRPQNTTVKVPFSSSSGTVEHLWGELRSLADSQMEVFLLTPPATHQGEVERLRSVPLTDLEDWQVELPDGSIVGGYSMRVMFQRAREQGGGELPRDLAQHARRYTDA